MKLNEIRRVKLNRYEIFAYLVLIGMGVIIIFIPSQYFDSHLILVQSCTSVGAGLITIGGLFLYYRALLIDPASQLKEITERIPTLLKSGITIGVEELYLTREEVRREEWMDLVRGAHTELGIAGFALQQFVAQADFPTLVAKLQAQGVSCRIILVHPESDDVKQRRVMDEPHSYGPVEGYIKSSVERLNLKLNGLKVLRLHRLAHTCDIVWVDHTMYVSQYLAGGPGGTSPCIRVVRKQGGIFDRYVEHFEALWKDKTTVTMEDFIAASSLPPPQS